MQKVTITTEFITLGQFLKFTNIIDSGAMAKAFLEDNYVLVNNEQEQRRGRKLYPGFEIAVGNTKYIITR